MMQFAQFISIVAHPLFMPVYTVLLIFNFNPYVQVHVSDDLQKLVLFGAYFMYHCFTHNNCFCNATIWLNK